MNHELCRTERDSIIADARSSEGKSASERMAMFRDLMETIDAIWQGLSPEERLRRLRIGEQLNRRPDPWWKLLKPGALPDSKCNS